MVRFLSDVRNNVLLCAALIALSACAHIYTVPSPYPRIDATLTEARVWIDIMPGAPERGYALWNLALTNTSDTPITILAVAGGISDTLGGPAIRRFACIMEKDGQTLSSLELLPGSTQSCLIKSTAGFEPFDAQRFNYVRTAVVLTVTSGEPFVIESAPIPVIITQ